ncbi:AI-2E family transporter [Massilia sp. CF038]|uniref:AI-2E family transporter n=1 Tax=Massilia sp. CF038 TaxID=1881045 RepID=UPI000921299C|nr:AI-2E family transporter [Massilia sp. CF038]SHH53010.1 Predicted PurR-regulated permease PerM [Massilia sp. CF038]
MPFLSTPEQKQTAFWLVLWLAFGVLIYALGPIMAPFIAAAILAYALNGAVDYLDNIRLGNRLTIPRTVAVIIVMTAFIAALLALVLIVVPVLQKEIPLLQAQIPLALTKLNLMLAPHLAAAGIHVQLDPSGIRALLSEQLATSGDGIWTMALGYARAGGVAVLSWIVTLTLVPVVLFYMLLDWHQILRSIALAVPRRWVVQTRAMALEVDALLAQYLRGQLLVMLVLAIFYSSVLALFGLEVALPVGILSGLLVFIPYIGFGLGLALALVAAVLQFPGWYGLIMVAGVYGVGQVLEGFILTPRLVGERIGLNALTVIFALLAFGQLFGFVGVLLALPASAVLMVAFRHLRRHYLRSSFYNA